MADPSEERITAAASAYWRVNVGETIMDFNDAPEWMQFKITESMRAAFAAADVVQASEVAQLQNALAAIRDFERNGTDMDALVAIRSIARAALAGSESPTPAPKKSSRSRQQLAVAFLKQTFTARLEIARKLGVDADLDDLAQQEANITMLRRIRETDQIAALDALLPPRIPGRAESPTNPDATR